MSNPVPLTGPDGRPWAWACGRCYRLPCVGQTLAPVQDIDDQADRFREYAGWCCVCDECKQPVDDDARGGLSCTRCGEARRAKQAVEHEALVAKLAAEGRRLCPNRFCGIEGDCETCGDEGTVPL